MISHKKNSLKFVIKYISQKKKNYSKITFSRIL